MATAFACQAAEGRVARPCGSTSGLALRVHRAAVAHCASGRPIHSRSAELRIQRAVATKAAFAVADTVDESDMYEKDDSLQERVVQVRRVTKVVKGGKQLSFRAVVSWHTIFRLHLFFLVGSSSAIPRSLAVHCKMHVVSL